MQLLPRDGPLKRRRFTLLSGGEVDAFFIAHLRRSNWQLRFQKKKTQQNVRLSVQNQFYIYIIPFLVYRICLVPVVHFHVYHTQRLLFFLKTKIRKRRWRGPSYQPNRTTLVGV